MENIKILKKSIIAWVWFSLTALIVWISYATLSSLMVNSWDTLTAEKWNAVIEEMEPVAAHYTVNTTENFSCWTAKIINFGAKEYDTHNAVTTWAWWNFLVPKDWLYHISSNISIGLYDWNQNESVWLALYKNWVWFKLLWGWFVSDTSVETNWNFGWSTTIKVLEWDTISLWLMVRRSGVGTISNINPSSVDNWVSIERIWAYPQ